jgi:hypothetical protein
VLYIAILSSIFFHRLFGSIRPLSPPREVLEITYPSVDDPALHALIDEKLTRLTAALDTSSQYIANQPYAESTQHQRVPYPAPSDSFTYIPNSFGGGSDQSDLGGDFARATSTAIASVASPAFASSVGTGTFDMPSSPGGLHLLLIVLIVRRFTALSTASARQHFIRYPCPVTGVP